MVLWEAVLIAELRGLIRQAFESTMRITSMVIFILIGSTVFTLVFRGVDGDLWIEHLLTSLPGGVVGFLVFVNLFVFVLAFFLDFFEIAFIIIPLLAPVASKLGIDLIWFGVLLCVNMQTSFMHPPFGFALFYLRGIAPKEVKSSAIYWGAIPWVGLQLIMVAIVIFWPGPGHRVPRQGAEVRSQQGRDHHSDAGAERGAAGFRSLRHGPARQRPAVRCRRVAWRTSSGGRSSRPGPSDAGLTPPRALVIICPRCQAGCSAHPASSPDAAPR